MPFRFRHAICNEIFDKWDFSKACRFIKSCGYEGIEIAHFTLADSPSQITAEQRREYRQIIADEGLEFVGLHWLMVAPKGLHVTTPDAELRARSWRHIDDLIDLCADLGPKGVMVFGSPYQRGATGGATREEATKNYVDGLAGVAKHAEERGVTILVEALPIAQTDVILTLDEAASIVRQINSPAVQTMFDSHNAVDEREPHERLVARHFDLIRHVHVNEMDGGHCGTGDYDFKPVLRALRERDYPGWISLEAFKFEPGAETIARESIDYLRREIEALGGR
ncbi:MAG: sugar phosphate isomerase/epimerase family protein [Bryobacteraceae bacterium]|nr:sugar phosphate isomerase/epimerase family protein [Bryobacteraceae bacterium]